MTTTESSGRRRALPWWLSLVLGVACAAFGVVLVFRPFSSLSVLVLLVAIGLIVLGISSLTDTSGERRWWSVALGVLFIVGGAVALGWPEITVKGLALIVGISLIVGGVVDVVSGLRGTSDERLAAVISGVASVIFGVLALTWPDVTVLVIAVVFGFRLTLFGVRSAWAAWRRHHGASNAAATDARPRGRWHRVAHVLVSLAALIVALALAGLSSRLNEAEPRLDAFYDTPDELPAQAGVLLRQEPFDRQIPDGAMAWRILYTTTSAGGAPTVASGIVVVPRAANGEIPVVAWAHGTTGVARRCAPSALVDPWSAGAFFSLDRVVDAGWALVAPDYVGLGAGGEHPYLVGEPAARSVLDAVRAARQLPDVTLGDQTVVWGHSQGGGVALWTGIIAPAYAPEAGVIGIAALAPASDAQGLMQNLGTVTGGSIFASYALRGYSSYYEDVTAADYVRDVARTTYDELSDRCLNGAALASALSALTVGMEMFSTDLTWAPSACDSRRTSRSARSMPRCCWPRASLTASCSPRCRRTSSRRVVPQATNSTTAPTQASIMFRSSNRRRR